MLLHKGVCALLALGFGAAAASRDLDGIYALAKRRAPAHAHEFTFALFEGEADAFKISDAHSGIHIQCTTVSACARGFYA